MRSGVQEKHLESTLEQSGEDTQKPQKRNKNLRISFVDGEKTRTLQSPKTDNLQRGAKPGMGASEISWVTLDPLSAAGGRPRMALDQPS